MKCWKGEQSFTCKVVLLDQQEFTNNFEENTLGEDVLKVVFDRLGLMETTYFGLRYIDPSNQTHWLDPLKKIQYQIKSKRDYTFYFGVKFYAVDPCSLREEATRYQFFLQIKQDILQGRLPISFDLAAELGAFVVQSELGDFDPRRHTPGYVSEFRFVSNQSAEMEGKIAQLHRGMTGKKPALAELCYLDKVKDLEMYGVDLHPVLGEDNTEYFLGLTPTGVIVLRNKNKVASYSWAKIVRMYRKSKYFMIQVPDSKQGSASTLGFETPSKEACKHLHKCCFEQCDFFKNYQPVDCKSSTNDINRLQGSQQFVRVPSKRYQRRPNSMNADSEPKSLPTPDVDVSRDNKAKHSLERASQSNHWERSESPKSIQSLPPLRGLYSSNNRISSSRRSVSVESRSSNDSKSVRCSKHGSRKGSDSESEVSKYSTKSRRRRNRSKRSTSSQRNKHRYTLVDSKEQWKEVQRKQSYPETLVQQAKVVSPRSHISDGDESHFHTKSSRHRKHRRSTPRSSGETKSYLPEELKRHLDFNLIDTEGMSETQLREIPYKVVETSVAKAVKVKLSSGGGRSHHHHQGKLKTHVT